MTAWEVIRWWEIRRILYNAVLLVIGIASIFGMEWLVDKTPNAAQDAPALETGLSVIVYGIIANLCYSLGWLIELYRRGEDAVEARRRAKRLFLLGLGFSCLLTTTPFWLGFVFWLLHRNS
jgi:hypothetical protein